MPRMLSILSILLAALVTGCHGNDSPQDDGLVEIRLGYIPIADCAHLYVASSQHIWSRHGLKVKETSMAGGARILEALAAGSLDVAFTNVVSLALARSRGLPFISVGGAVLEDEQHDPHRLLMRSGAVFSGPADLRGKSIAVNTLRNIDQMVVGEYLASGGVALDQATLREVPFPRMEAVLLSGEIDAASAIEPYVTLASADDRLKSPVDHFLAMSPRTLIATYAMKEDKARGTVGQAVARVLAEAARWAAQHDSETRLMVAEYTGLDVQVTASMKMSRLESAPTRADMQAMLDRAEAAGLLGETVPRAEDWLLP